MSLNAAMASMHGANNMPGPVNRIGTSDMANGLLRVAATCTGSTAKKILAARKAKSLRLGVELHNADSTYELWVVGVPTGSDAPTISSSDRNWVVPAKSTLLLEYGSDIDIYVLNSSGAATTSAYTATEVRR